MKKIFYAVLPLLCAGSANAQSDSTVRTENSSIRKFKEQLRFSDSQAAQLDSIFAIHAAAKNSSEAAAVVCLRAKDSEISAILTSQQQSEYEILKQEWKARKAAQAGKRKR